MSTNPTRISSCKTAKEIWDTLEITHEGTEEIKRSRINTFSQEYEMFRMLLGERILDIQKRFSHLTNHLTAAGKSFTSNDLNLKVLRSLTRAMATKGDDHLRKEKSIKIIIGGTTWKIAGT